MREIKFRAWYYEEMKNMDWIERYIEEGSSFNGLAIYEGDILHHYKQGNRFVEYGDNGAERYGGYMLVNKDGWRGTLQDTEQLYEVIGNIYENAELFDAK